MPSSTQYNQLESAKQALKRKERIGKAYALGILPALTSVALLLFVYRRIPFGQTAKLWALGAVGVWVILYLYWCRQSKKKQAEVQAAEAAFRKLEVEEKLAQKERAFSELLAQLEQKTSS